MKDNLHSPKVRAILIILGAVIVILIVFALGIAVGYRRALFASRFGEDYFRNFSGGMMGAASFNAHGVAGDVIDLTSSSLSVQGNGGDEEWVTITSGTVIRDGDETITIENIVPGNMVAVIGDPNDSGQILARFVRVFPAPSAMPLPPGMVMPGQ